MNRFFTFLILMLFWSAALPADIINVPGDQPNIQAGINAATNGDTVLVEDGTYYENINFKGKSITVASHYWVDGDTNHINNTIIDGSQSTVPDSGSVVYFISGEDTNSVLSGFTITGGSGTPWVLPGWPPALSGGGIYAMDAGAKIENNRIIGNHITTTGDTVAVSAGIVAGGDIGDYHVIRDNVISQNSETATNTWANGSISLWSKETCLFERNRVHNNDCYAPNSSATGGGLCIDGGVGHQGPYIIRNNIISDNELHSTIGGGSGIAIWYTSPILINNIISGNSGASSWGGGGILIDHYGNPTQIKESVLINNTIINNSVTGDGGGIQVRGPMIKATVINTILWGNSASSGSQIHTTNGGSIEVRYSDVQGSWPGEGNIDANPFFTDPLYNLGDSSLCIGAGIDSIQIGANWYYAPSYDFDGDPRPNPPGYMPDIGAQESPLAMPVSIEPLPGLLPSSYMLRQNYPNPFNPSTTIEFSLPKAGLVTLTIYNVAGEKVATLIAENLTAGSYKYQWDARGLASGVYFYKLETEGFVQTKKMLLIR